ncbi:MAG: InlB B-repeat-containing protein [Oscillospiraceae bacterium]|nr:InlB B-repeat-containing protein [Oscillospiraceae bacterium]
MLKHTRKLFAVLLVMVLVLGLFPTFAAAETTSAKRVHVFTALENAALDTDVFAKIELAKANAAQPMGGVAKLQEADYVNMIPQVIDAIKSSKTYVPGTLQQNGNFLVWETTVGIPCCYDPRMEAELHNTENEPSAEEIARIEAQAEAMVQDFSQTRGGSPSSAKIGLIQPYWESSSSYSDSSFTSYSPYYKTVWQNLYGATGGTGMRYSMTNATVDNIANTLEQCGLVIFDSHGTTDYSGSNGDYTSRANSSYLCLTTNSGVTSTDTAARTGTYGTYYNAMKGSGYAYVNGDCIAAHMDQNAPNSMLYMGICLGMATDKMFTGLRAKGVEVVYGYSQSVSFKGELQSIQSIMRYIQNGKTAAYAIEQSQVDLGCQWDPAYSSYSESSARSNKVAFPVVVSDEDTYLGHGNVDCVQTAHSTWTLFGSTTSYTVTATSNNTSYGTVSVSGNTITASPKTGYYAAGYTVTSGTATVVQNGNTFTVTPSSNCTVRINFAAKSTYTLTYKANGTTIKTASVYSGEAAALPTTATAYDGYTFVGWALNTVSETTTKPSYYAPGASYTPTASTTFYAVYTRVSGGTGSVTYNLVSSAPSDWAGNYVITYGSSPSYVLTGMTPSSNGASIESTSNRTAYSSTGMSLSSSKLSNVADKYVFTVASTGSYYTIRSKTTGTYLGMTSGSYLAGYTTYSSSYCRWTMGVGSSASSAKNAANGSYPYLGFTTSSNYFWSNSSANTSIRWWKETSNGTTYYSTTISAQTDPDPVTPDPEPTTTYTVSFSVPSGVAAISPITVEPEEAFTLPTAGAPSGYTFVGWVTSTVSATTTAPTSYAGGTSVTTSGSLTLYALYTYTQTTSGTGGYQLVTSAPSSWTGDYVITCGTGSDLYAMKGLSGNTKYESASAGGAVALASTGMSLNGTTLTNVPNAYVFTVGTSGSYYTFKNKSTGTYLGSYRSYLYSRTSLSTSYCRWSMSMNGTAVNLYNSASSSYPYMAFSSSNYFMMYSASNTTISLWKYTSSGSGSTTYYTTL